MRPIWARRRDAAAFHLGTPRLGQPEIQGSQQTLRWRGLDSNFRFRARGAIDLSSRLSSMFLKMFVSAERIYGRDRAGGYCRVAPERQTVALPPEAAVIC